MRLAAVSSPFVILTWLACFTWTFVRQPAAAVPSPTLNASALIVIGLAADESQAKRMREQAETARAGFVARGIPSNAVTILPAAITDLVRRDAVLSAVRAAKASVDETWVVLLGHAAMGRDGKPAFQVSGPRVSAGDLAVAVSTLPGRKFVVLGTARSGGFLAELLVLPGVEAVAATTKTGEINEPRFPQMWIDALVATPTASFRELAVEAAARVAAFYQQRSLGQGEHAQLIDRATGKIIEAPFTSPP